ncbi:MAG: hypothetical protein EBY81_00155 [Verrucomicrobia bacterium]|nr:hypothetical protein [Verrucomicrobiota bacterium]
MSQPVQDEGILFHLRRQGETSFLAVWLTRQHGVVRTLAFLGTAPVEATCTISKKHASGKPTSDSANRIRAFLPPPTSPKPSSTLQNPTPISVPFTLFSNPPLRGSIKKIPTPYSSKDSNEQS